MAFRSVPPAVAGGKEVVQVPCGGSLCQEERPKEPLSTRLNLAPHALPHVVPTGPAL
jgi:hypothetical protein